MVEVNRAIDSGVRYLQEIQRLDGSFGGQERMGLTALLTYALIKSGLTPEDSTVARALARLEVARHSGTYDQACLALALAAAGRPEDQARLQRVLDTLVEIRGKSGTWAYPSGSEDLSNTQFALLGLHAGVKGGGTIPTDLWRSVARAVGRYRAKGRGFSYHMGGNEGSQSMTAAGIGSLAICRLHLQQGAPNDPTPGDRLINDGLSWLDRNFEPKNHLYTWYGIERVGALTGRERIGGEDWYAAGAAAILRLQREDGSFAGNLPGTAYSLLFLNRATGPSTGKGARSGQSAKREVHSLREGGIHLQGIGRDPCQMWISGWSKPLRELHAWPGEVRRGLRITKVVWFVNGRAVKEIMSESTKANETQRFEFEHSFTQSGKYQVQAQVHLLAPLNRDQTGPGSGESVPRVINSQAMLVEFKPKAFDPLVQVAQEHARNLIDLARWDGQRASASASTKDAAHSASLAIDGDYHTHWRATQTDRKPSLRIKLKRPILADTILLTQPLSWPIQSGALPRVFEAEVKVNGKSVGVVRMHSDERRKGRLSLTEPCKVSSIRITLTSVVPGADPKMGGGLGEVELLLGD